MGVAGVMVDAEDRWRVYDASEFDTSGDGKLACVWGWAGVLEWLNWP